MHKKFIKKGNKTFGPYYYTTIRDSGKIKSFYLGQDEEIARQKEKEIKKKYDVKELSHTLSYEQEPRPVLPYITLALLITAVLVFPFILQFRLNGLFIGLESVSYEKIQDDPTFDVIVDSISFEGNDLVVNFHHNSEQAQPVLVMGNISFSLSTDILGPGETAQLAVQDWDGSYFELKVGNESEIIAFYIKAKNRAEQNLPHENQTENVTEPFAESPPTSIDYEKIEADSEFDLIIDSVSLEGNDLVIDFHHTSNQVQPITIEGDVVYELSHNQAEGGQQVHLKVFDWTEDKYFEIKIGNQSEIVGFGKIPEYNINTEIFDAEGQPVPAEIVFEKPEIGKMRITESATKMKKGKYDIRVRTAGLPIKEIWIKNVDVKSDISDFIKLDDVPESIGPADAVEVYAIDPTALNFTEALVTATAKGTELYKCKEWDFTERKCNGEWIYLMNIVPGEDYSFVLTPEDPAYAEYNYSNYQIEGHMAWSSDNALSKPPSGGPAVPNEKELNSTQYSQINASDNVRASVASANYRTFRFMFKLNQSTSRIVNLTIAWEGYTTGATAAQRRVDLYVWNFTSNSWSASLANNNLAADYWLIYTFAPSSPEEFKHIINSTNHIIFLVETPDPPGTQTFYTDTANISVWYNLPPNVTLVSPPDGNVTTSNAVNFTCNATDDLQLSSITFYWNYSGSWQANGTVSVSGTSNQTTFERTNLSNGAILWNCQACDNESACSFAPANWTVTVNYTPDSPPTVTLSYPPDNYYNDTSQYVNLTFNASVTDDYALVNCSLWHNYTGTWHLNQTQTVTGTSNVTNFSLNNLTNKTFIWNIQCYDNASQSAFAPANRTVILNWTPYNTSIDISLLRLDYSTFPTNDSYNFIGEALEMGEMHHFWPAVNYSYANGSPVSGADISAIFGKDAGIYYGYFGFDPPHIHNHTKIYDFTLKEDNYIAVNFTDVYNLTESNSLSITFAVCKVGQSDVTGEVRINNQLSWTGSSLIGNIFSNQTSQCPSESLVYLKNISAFKDADSFYIMIGCPNCSNSEYYVVPRTNNTNGWFVPNRSLQTESGDSGWQLMPDSEQNNWVIYVHKYFDNFSDFNFTYNSSTGLYIDKSKIYVTEEDSITNITANASKQDHEPATKTEYIVNLPIGTIVNIDDLIDSVTVHQNPQNGTTVEYGNITLIWSAFHPRGIDYFYSNLTYANGSTISYNDTAFVVHWPAELFTEINTIYNLTVWANSTTGQNESEVLWFYVNDTLAPSIYYNPNTTENGTYSKNWIFINVTCSDLKKDTVILNWNGSNESFDNNEGDIYWENKTGLNEGIYTFYAWCNDTSGNSNQTETRIITIYFNKAPQISLNEPSNNTQLNDTQDMNFNFTATDDLNTTLNCSIYLDDNLNQTNSSTLNNTLTNFLIQGISYGSHNWSISCTDGELSNVSETRYFVIADTIGPTILFVSPTPDNNTVLSRNWITINASVSDTASNIDTCILEWNGSNESMTKVGSGPNVTCYANKTGLTGNTNYTYKVYANDTSNNWNVSETRNVFIGTPPSVVILHPSPGEVFDENDVVVLIANITDPDGLNLTVAEVTLPNSSKQNVTLYIPPNADNFDTNTVGIAWAIENHTGAGQICVADIDTTVPDMAYTAISGNGSPFTDTYCGLVSMHPICGDFDMNITFNVTYEEGIDYAMLFALTENPTIIGSSKIVFMSIGNWTGYGRTYDVFINDGNISDYISERPTNDTYGKFRIKREGNNFTFYTWNNTANDWYEEAHVENVNMPCALFINLESETAEIGWGSINVTWDDLIINGSQAYTGMFSDTSVSGIYNVTFIARDNLGAINDSEQTYFNISEINDAPSTPYILQPSPGWIIRNTVEIRWSDVYDEENDSLQFNITLLNPDYSENATIVTNYGNASTTNYEWNTTLFQDGNYSLKVVVFENETAEGLSSYSIMTGTFSIDNTPPAIAFVPPTETSGSIINRNYIQVNVTADDEHLDYIEVYLYNSTHLLNQTMSVSSPYFVNFTDLSDGVYYFNASAYDAAGNINSTETRTIILDTQAPNYSDDQDDSGGSVVEGTIVNISVLWQDNHQLDTAIFRTNQSGSWQNVSTCALSGAISWCNTTIDTSGDAGKIICWNQWANDSAGNLNTSMSETAHCFNVTAIDKPPIWSGNQTNIPAIYSFNASQFNITWQDDVEVSVVLIEGNWSGEPKNYTMALIAGNSSNGTYSYSQVLPAGTFYWRSWANDTANQWNTSDVWIFTINKATTSLNLSAQPAWSVTYGTQTNITCSANNNEAQIALYRNDSQVASGYGLVYESTTLAAGLWNYTCNTSGSQNWTAASVSNLLTVNKAPTTVNLTLNGVEDNITITYPQTVTAIFWTNALTATLYRNGTDVSSENNTAITLPAGYWNYTVINPGNENYTGSSKTLFATVNKATSSCSLTFNPPSPTTYGIATTATCTCTNPEASARLWRNGTDITSENGTAIILPAGAWSYVCNVSESQNYTSASNSSVYVVNKATSNLNLTLNGVAGNLTVLVNSSVNITAKLINPTSGYIELYENGTMINNGSSPLTNITYYNMTGLWNITAIYPETQNYTGASKTHWVIVTNDTTPPIVSIQPSATSLIVGQTLHASCSATDNIGVASVNMSIDGSTLCSGTTSCSGSWTAQAGNWILTCYAKDLFGNTAKSSIAINVRYPTHHRPPAQPPAQPPTYQFPIDIISPEQPADIGMNIGPLRGLSIAVGQKNKNVNINISAKECPPINTTRPVYACFEIDHNITNITQVNISFCVNNSWIAKNNVTSSILARLTEGWDSLLTIKTKENENETCYEAISPNLSWFAILGLTIPQVCQPLAKQCAGYALQQCNIEGTGWVDIENCTYGCNISTLSCNPAPTPVYICEPGQRRCAGRVVQECNGTAWLDVEECRLLCFEGNCIRVDGAILLVLAGFLLIFAIIRLRRHKKLKRKQKSTKPKSKK